MPEGLDERVVEVYRAVGQLLSRYTTGKVRHISACRLLHMSCDAMAAAGPPGLTVCLSAYAFSTHGSRGPHMRRFAPPFLAVPRMSSI